MSFKSIRTNVTYVIESYTNVSDGTKIHNEQKLTESLSCVTLGMCNRNFERSTDVKGTSVSPVRAIEMCSSNVETSGRRAKCETYRTSRFYEGGRCNFDITEAHSNDITRSARGYSLLTKVQDDVGESFAREGSSHSSTLSEENWKRPAAKRGLKLRH